jgi:hypothetical protein
MLEHSEHQPQCLLCPASGHWPTSQQAVRGLDYAAAAPRASSALRLFGNSPSSIRPCNSLFEPQDSGKEYE